MEVHDTKISMHDGPSCNRSKTVAEFLRKSKVKTLEWPGNSPDLNPIKNLWTYMKDKLAEKQPSNAEALRMAIKEVWSKEIKPEYIVNL